MNSSGIRVIGIRRESSTVRKEVSTIHTSGITKINDSAMSPTQKNGPLRSWR